jgi:signal transduction histidine kinase
MKNWSLRTKLTLWSALITAFTLVTFGLVAAVSLYVEQLEEVDRHLAANAQEFVLEARQRSAADVAEIIRRDDEPHFGFAFFVDGRVVSGEPGDLYERLINRTPRKKFTTLRLNEKFLRLGYFPYGENRALLVAVDLRHVMGSLVELGEAYLLALPIMLVVVGAGSWWVARRALAPIAAIADAASAITAEKLSTRLPAPPANDEIARLTGVLNAMFDRLERGFAQATRFSADASHELRTPLTILRGEIEQGLHAGGSAEQEKILVSLLEQVGGLQKISDNLLLLARFDAGKSPAQLAPLDLSALVSETVEDAELLAAPAKLKVSADVTPALRVSGDAVLLRRLLLNLVDNAVRYNRPGGEVKLALRRDDASVVLVIANTGAGFPAEKRGELFQRFFRLAADRNRATGGSGLGLSLCREIAAAHGGRIELARSADDVTEFAVTLPAL